MDEAALSPDRAHAVREIGTAVGTGTLYMCDGTDRYSPDALRAVAQAIRELN